MPRNKHPEVTVNRILDVSLKLFMEQGYENTSVQDIIDNLGGLTKGAIYHHFKSKEEIMLAVMDRLYGEQEMTWLQGLQGDTSRTGLEKLQSVLRESMSSERQVQMFSTAPDMLKNPKMIVMFLKSIMEESAPLYLLPIIQEGIEDGSLQSEYPEELAQMILLLTNIWLSPFVFQADVEATKRRVRLFQQMMQGLGIDLLDEETVQRFEYLCNLYTNKK